MMHFRLYLPLKVYIFSFLFLLGSFSVFAQVTNTASAGNWSNSGNWDNGVPANGGASTVNNNISIDQDIVIEGTCTANNYMLDVVGGNQCKAEIKGFGVFNINDDVTFEGEVKLSNDASVAINGCTVFTVGDLLVENNATFSVSACSKLIVNGNLTIKNNIGIQCDGIIEIYGDVDATNSSSVFGVGSLSASGSVSISSPASMFGSGSCIAPQCISGAALPVELISFNANVNGDEIDLKWITATEINNSYFTIERSSDTKNWEEILTVNGAGNSNQVRVYFEVDYEPMEGISYYRLKQTDFNGDFKHFNIVPVRYKRNNTGKGAISLFPNPSNPEKTVRLEFENIYESELLVVLRDIKGREFYSKVFVNIEDGKLIGVPIEKNVPGGVYLVTASSENHIYSQKLIIK